MRATRHIAPPSFHTFDTDGAKLQVQTCDTCGAPVAINARRTRIWCSADSTHKDLSYYKQERVYCHNTGREWPYGKPPFQPASSKNRRPPGTTPPRHHHTSINQQPAQTDA